MPPSRPVVYGVPRNFSGSLLQAGRLLCVMRMLVVTLVIFGLISRAAADDGVAFFETKIRPALVEHCYECHSAESKKLRGELRLDLKAGWQLGGESGEPAVVPGSGIL